MPFLLTLGVLVTIMISFCVKKAHSLSKDYTISKNQEKENDLTNKLCSSVGNTDEGKPWESSDEVKSLMPYFSTAVTATVISETNFAIVKKDRGELGFLDEVGGGVDGLMSCTESLGFESSDERRVDDDLEDINERWKDFPRKVPRTVVKSEVKKFPPPLTSLSDDGKPNFFLRPMRSNGRLELAEVKIERPEILRASREDGRLRLHFVQELEQVEKAEEDSDCELEEIIENFVEEKGDEKWLFPTTMCCGERLRRCHEAVTRHYHHDLHGWRQPCMVIR